MKKIRKIIEHLQKPVLVFVLIILLLSSFVADYKPAEAATFTWTQASWAGGTSATAATHDAHRDGLTAWTYYSSASTTISASTNITLSTTASSTTQTTTADFNTGTTSQTTVASNSVALALQPGSANFSYTGGQQTWVVPTGITSVTVDVAGASGAAIVDRGGRLGGRVTTTLSVTPNSTLYIYVGGAGSGSTGGYNGGGNGGGGTYYGAGGGGASDIRIGGTALSNRYVVAAAGGGEGGGLLCDGEYCGLGIGGNGGGLTGGDGGTGGSNYGGGGGTQGGGGAGGSGYCYNGGAGGSGIGGNSGTCEDGGGGGGGGGYYGGGGAGAGGGGGGGGGGSSYTPDNCTSPTTCTSGYQSGNGYVNISYASTSYYSSGTFTSGIVNIGLGVPSWGNLSWTKTGTGTVTMEARSCDDAACSGETWTGCSVTNGGSNSCMRAGEQYFQYRASLSTTDTTVTPSLDDVTIGYNIYTTTNVLTSSKYNTSSDANIMGGIKWDEDASLPTGTTVTASLRTASSEANLDSASWTNFTNATSNCSKPSGTVTCNSSAIPSGMKDGTGDQWAQYKITLTSTGANAPTADNVVLTYVVNARPEFDVPNTTASQISDSGNTNWGKVQINYSIKDTDTLSGTTNPGYVTPSFEYNIGGGWVSITSGYLDSGALTNKAVQEGTYTNYTTYWDAKSQISGQYLTTAQIRITLNDNEEANNSTTTIISNITIDTTAPTLSTFTLDSSADTLTLASSDNSNIQYRISNNSDGSGTWQTVGAVSTSTTIAWTYAPDSTGYESVTIAYRDIYGNTSTTTDVAPYMPNNFYYKDICNTAINDWREFLSWGQYTATTSAAFGSYKVYRSIDGTTYSLLVTNTPYTLNYHVDTTVASTTTYYYKAVTVDSDGDISSYTTPVSDLPNGQGGSDSTAPIITSGPTVAETRSTWARITWTTDEISNSIVEYGTTQSYGSTKTVDTMNTSHSVTVTGLTPNTTYYYRVKSADIATNTVTSSESSFTTTQGTIISDVTTESITDTTATIVWNTNTDSNSWVYYSTNSSFTSSSTSGTNTLVGTSTNNYFQHRVTLTGLTERTTYYYYVKSTDANSDLATDTNAGSYYSFATTYDNQPPVISGILTPVRASNAIVIVWNTDENADTQVYYDTSTHAACSGYANSSTLDTNKTINHAVSLTSLTASTKYYYRVKSADANGNSTCSDEQNALTTAANEIITVYVGGGGVVSPTVTDTTPPSISNIKTSDIGAFTATVSFETSEAAIGLINYGKDASYGNTAGSDNYQSSHQIKLSGLKLGTEYHFRVKAADKNGNIGESEDQTLTTLFAAEVLEDLVTLENAEQFQEQLEGLLESVMPSLVPPFVSNVKIDEINEDSALVTWKTNIPAHGSLFFAEDSKYEEGKYTTEIAENKGKIKDHELKITDLIPSTKYHVQAKSYVFPGAVGKSKDYTFFTKSAKTKPEIINVGNTEFTVAWRTNKETSSFVQYTNTGTGQKGQTGTEEKTSQHVVKVENLTPDILYEVRVYGYDADNNLVEADPLTVRTKKDVVPPKISSININSAFVPYKADQLQTVISWKTDEPANSLVYFEEGVGISTDLKNKAGQLDEYVLDHSVIITNFKPATIYRIKIVSSDEARNTTVGPMRTILAPRASESVLEIITKNLEEAFGFLKNLNR